MMLFYRGFTIKIQKEYYWHIIQKIYHVFYIRHESKLEILEKNAGKLAIERPSWNDDFHVACVELELWWQCWNDCCFERAISGFIQTRHSLFRAAPDVRHIRNAITSLPRIFNISKTVIDFTGCLRTFCYLIHRGNHHVRSQ